MRPGQKALEGEKSQGIVGAGRQKLEIFFKGCVGLMAQKSWVMKAEPRAPRETMGRTASCCCFLAVHVLE